MQRHVLYPNISSGNETVDDKTEKKKKKKEKEKKEPMVGPLAVVSCSFECGGVNVERQ